MRYRAPTELWRWWPENSLEQVIKPLVHPSSVSPSYQFVWSRAQARRGIETPLRTWGAPVLYFRLWLGKHLSPVSGRLVDVASLFPVCLLSPWLILQCVSCISPWVCLRVEVAVVSVPRTSSWVIYFHSFTHGASLQIKKLDKLLVWCGGDRKGSTSRKQTLLFCCWLRSHF